MINNNFFSKNCSHMIQGLAIIFMIFHHQFSYYFFHECFCLRGSEWYLVVEQRIAWFGKICVALFAFCSGYGLGKLQEDEYSILNCYKLIFKRLIIFLMSYWFVLACTSPLEIIKADVGIRQVMLAFTTYDTSFNGGWWYIRQYIYMLIMSPALFEIIKGIKKKSVKSVFIGIAIALIVFCFFYFLLHRGSMQYLLVFILGMIAYYFEIYSWLYLRIVKYKRFSSLLCVLLITGCIIIRMILSQAAGDAWMDIILVPVLVFALSFIYRNHRFAILEWIGKNSIWFWLVSTSIQQIFEFEIKRLYYSELIIIVVYSCSFLIGCVLMNIFIKISGQFIVKKGI